MTILPNPTTGRLSVRLPVAEHASLVIKDVNGKTVSVYQINKEVHLNIEDLADGVYTLLVRGKNEFWVERIVKI